MTNTDIRNKILKDASADYIRSINAVEDPVFAVETSRFVYKLAKLFNPNLKPLPEPVSCETAECVNKIPKVHSGHCVVIPISRADKGSD